jgi:hypothetical protein
MRQPALALACLVALLAVACASAYPGAAGARTVTGKVVSFTDSAVTLETAGGRETVALTADTQGRDHLMVGARVVVDVGQGAGGAAVAVRIAPVAG